MTKYRDSNYQQPANADTDVMRRLWQDETLTIYHRIGAWNRWMLGFDFDTFTDTDRTILVNQINLCLAALYDIRGRVRCIDS